MCCGKGTDVHWREGTSRPDHHGGADLLAHVRIGYPKDSHFCDAWTGFERSFEFLRGYLFSAPADDFFDTPCDKKVALVIEIALIARFEPAIGEGCRVELWIVIV